MTKKQTSKTKKATSVAKKTASDNRKTTHEHITRDDSGMDEYRVDLLPNGLMEDTIESINSLMEDFRDVANNNLSAIQRRRKISVRTVLLFIVCSLPQRRAGGKRVTNNVVCLYQWYGQAMCLVLYNTGCAGSYKNTQNSPDKSAMAYVVRRRGKIDEIKICHDNHYR